MTPCTLPPIQIPYGTDESDMPPPCRTTSSGLFVAPRMPTFVNVPLMYSGPVNRYVPGATTIVLLEDIEDIALWSALTVDTLMTVPEGEASGGAGCAGAACAAPPMATCATNTAAMRHRNARLELVMLSSFLVSTLAVNR